MKNSPETLRKRQEKRAELRRTISTDSFPKFKKRKCKDCGKRRNCRWAGQFLTGTGKPVYRTKCDTCHNAYAQKLRKEDINYRPSATNKARLRKRKVKLRCIEYLGGACRKCGYNRSPRALTFHHLDRNTKKYTISQIKDWGWDKIKNELDKCELVCFNCHMEQEERYEQEREQNAIPTT